MTSFWEQAFVKSQRMWGHEPARSALLARALFAERGVQSVLVPGAGYGRNARVFVEAGMDAVGIEISETAIALAEDEPGPRVHIHHGSVLAMPFDARIYDAVFCHGLLYLLDAPGRTALLSACARQLAPGGVMVFTLIAKEAPMFGRGEKLGEDWFEPHPGVPMYFYDEASVARDFGPFGVVTVSRVDEPNHGGGAFPFLYVVCEKRA